MTPHTLRQLAGIVGQPNLLTSPEELVCYAYDASPHRSLPQAVVFPSSAGEISDILRLANQEGFPVVPRGSGTNLSGGSVPAEGGGGGCHHPVQPHSGDRRG